MSNFWDADPVVEKKAAPANFWETDALAKPQESHWSDAITDIPAEIGRTASANAQTVAKSFANRSEKGPVEGLLDTGRGMVGLGGLVASPVTGAFRSLIGHPMAQAEHEVGKIIAPEIAAKDDLQKMYETAAGDVDTAMSAARPAGAPIKVPTGAPKMAYDWQHPAIAAPTPTGAELEAAATSVYNSPAIKAIRVPPQDVTALGAKIENDLVQQGFRPTAGNAPDTFAEVQRLTPPNGVTAVGVDDLRSARRALNIAAGKKDPLTGTPLPDAAAAHKAIAHMDAFLDTLAPELRTANANYNAAKGSARLDYRVAKAERRAARSGTGGNLENVMRQEADKIPNRGLTPEEQTARDRIVLGSPARNALRTTGKLGVDGGLSLMLHTAAGLGSGGATVPITIGGTIARKLGEALTRGEIARLNRMIRERSPLAKTIAGSKIPQLPGASQGAIGAGLLAEIMHNAHLPRSIMPANAQDDQK